VLRKLVVLIVLATLLGLAGMPAIVAWFDRTGLIACARWARAEYVTGTAISVIVVLLFVLPGRSCRPRRDRVGAHQCPVCDSPQFRRGRYCPACGSRITS
jgi:hypothetical protein